MILTQELRRDVEGIKSPAPQPEDPERSLDPASEEDPDLAVELIDGVFHQLSIDNALVAITADYPCRGYTPWRKPAGRINRPDLAIHRRPAQTRRFTVHW